MPRVKLRRLSQGKQLAGKWRCPSHVELPPIGLPLAIGAVCPVTRVQPPALSEGGSRSISPRSSANRSSWDIQPADFVGVDLENFVERVARLEAQLSSRVKSPRLTSD